VDGRQTIHQTAQLRSRESQILTEQSESELAPWTVARPTIKQHSAARQPRVLIEATQERNQNSRLAR
jgi:hypothetical protein